MVQTPRLERELAAQGYRNIVSWTRGVDTQLFKPWRDEPGFDADFLNLPRPIFLSLGRVSREKNLEAFLSLDLPGSKVVVGGGPQLEEYKARFPGVTFTGPKSGDDVARHFSAADVFVFPSRFDTFGLVLLESIACGTPVAAFPVRGPADVITSPDAGVLSEDLRDAALSALALDRSKARQAALPYSWRAATEQFQSHLAPQGLAAALLTGKDEAQPLARPGFSH
jgi:glycosyltransferase involved in cell wall biosynthesis